jgi:drug/metabolite transporter (DMT)-like permease
MNPTESTVVKAESPGAIISLMLGSVVWGLAWWPLKYFGQLGLDGHAIALTAYTLLGVLSIPLIWRERYFWLGEWRLLVLIGVLFGLANFLFTWSLMVGSVVRSMLLFFLLPAWGVIGGWLFLSEQLNYMRLLAVALCLAGVFTIVGGFAVFETPLSFADAAAFIAGVAYTGAGITNRAARDIPIVSRTCAGDTEFVRGQLGLAACVCFFLDPWRYLALNLWGDACAGKPRWGDASAGVNRGHDFSGTDW